jgi:hypothetical protein
MFLKIIEIFNGFGNGLKKLMFATPDRLYVSGRFRRPLFEREICPAVHRISRISLPPKNITLQSLSSELRDRLRPDK